MSQRKATSIVGAERFAPFCPDYKDQVRIFDTKGQVKICSAQTSKDLIMIMLLGGELTKTVLFPSMSASNVFADRCHVFIGLSSLDYEATILFNPT